MSRRAQYLPDPVIALLLVLTVLAWIGGTR